MTGAKKPRPIINQQVKTPTICRMTQAEVKNNLTIIVNTDWCKGCGFCVAFCPTKVLEPSSQVNLKGAHFPTVKFPEQCTTCRQCEHGCPDLAIYLVDQDATPGPALPTAARKMEIKSFIGVPENAVEE